MARILLVDPLRSVREALAMAITAHGFDVDVAEDGRQALRCVRTAPVDVIILDIALPDRGGFRLLQAIRIEPAIRMPHIIVFTTEASREAVLMAAKLGVSKYLLRSRSIEDLIATVQACLEPDSADTAAAASNADGPAGGGASSAASGPALPAASREDALERLKEIRPVATRAEVKDRLELRAEVKAFSPTITKLLALTNNPESSMDAIVRTIKQDHSLAIRILKLANSSVYTRGDPVDTIPRAVTRIGLSEIRQAVLNVAAVESFSETIIGGMVGAGDYWEHAIATGLIAAEIMHRINPGEADVAFTMGLVHDIGRIMMSDEYPDEYSECLRLAAELGLSVDVVEKRMFGMTHAECMDRLLHHWKFPKELIDPIVFHHLSVGNIRRMAPRRVIEVTALALADRLAHALLLGASGNDTIAPTVEMCQTLNLDQAALREISERIEGETENLKLAMLASVAGGGSCGNRRSMYIDLIGAPSRAIYLSAYPEFDSFAVLCEQLSDATLEQPNYAVIAADEAQEARRLVERLLAAECERGLGPLPTIMICAAGKLGALEAFAKSRTVSWLQPPIPLRSWVETVATMIEPAAVAVAA